MHQSSLIRGDGRLGTIITSKGKRFFDFKMKVDVMTRSRGSAGVVFRMVDPFNFLAFDLNIEQGAKRILKVENGNISVLKEIYDGGISQNNWFKIFIRVEKTKFVIRCGDAKRYSSYTGLPIVFEFENSSFPKGE